MQAPLRLISLFSGRGQQVGKGLQGYRLCHVGVVKVFLAARKETYDPDRVQLAEFILAHEDEEIMWPLRGDGIKLVIQDLASINEAICSVVPYTSETVIRRLPNRKAFLFRTERLRRGREGLRLGIRVRIGGRRRG